MHFLHFSKLHDSSTSSVIKFVSDGFSVIIVVGFSVTIVVGFSVTIVVGFSVTIVVGFDTSHVPLLGSPFSQVRHFWSDSSSE